MNALQLQLARFVSKACELILQLHLPYQRSQSTDEEFKMNLSIDLFSYYDGLLNIMKHKLENKQKCIKIYLFFYIQDQEGQNLLEKWKMTFKLDAIYQDEFLFLRQLASLAVSLPFNKFRKNLIFNHQVLFDDSEKVKTPPHFAKYKLNYPNVTLSLKYLKKQDFELMESSQSVQSQKYFLNKPQKQQPLSKEITLDFSKSNSFRVEFDENYMNTILINKIHKKSEDLQREVQVDDNKDDFSLLIDGDKEISEEDITVQQQDTLKRLQKLKMIKNRKLTSCIDQINSIKEYYHSNQP